MKLYNRMWKICMALIWMQSGLLIYKLYIGTREFISHGQSVNRQNEKVKLNKNVIGRQFEIKVENENFLSGNEFQNNSVPTNGRDVKLHFIVDGICNETFSPAHLNIEETWQQTDKEKGMYVYSAYYVERRRSVFIIGVKLRRPVNFICQLWNKVDGERFRLFEETTGKISAPSEGLKQKYTSTIFRCPLNSSGMPTHISLVTESCQTPMHLLLVHNASKPSNYRRQFTVCLSPLNFRYGRAYELVEWIELNKILGAEYFMVYNYSSARNVKDVLDYYSKHNVAEVVQWRLPMGVNTFPKTNETVEINYFGQTAALNDCLFRNKQFSEFVVNADVDEFIIPHSNGTFSWSDIIKQLHNNAPVYVFKNTFFRKDWERKILSFTNHKVAKQLRLVTLQVFEHEAMILPAGQRSKYIARTADVDLMLTHEVPNVNSLTVSENLGLLHHYRDWERPNDKERNVTDITVQQKYEHILIQNVRKVWQDLVNVKMDIPII